ncbi:MAG TPA: phytanoyl-CoA dioxygenase family protein [Tepidisphaeraceae bacterium]|jgi:ectoine hydroxylase-related dioxygenase (phytanoyl-CoA dioxygenase family)|nr:phytanoyl-CoA dioxygenase family protein [Tepidisphaeraceae bacterium]
MSYASFRDSTALRNDPIRLRAQMNEDGYLFLRGAAPREEVLNTRRDVLTLCDDAGWLDAASDLMEGKWSGAGPFTEGEAPYMKVYKEILGLKSFHELPAHPAFMDLMAKILGGPVLLHNRRIGRVTFPNNTLQTTAAHQDYHYIRGTSDTYTIWLPLGDCPIALGGLAVLRGSHKAGLIEHRMHAEKKYAGHGLDDDQLPPGLQWDAGDFQAGDFLVFHSYTIHKALPNLTPDRLRLSIDNRYQRQNEAIEPGSLGTHYNL